MLSNLFNFCSLGQPLTRCSQWPKQNLNKILETYKRSGNQGYHNLDFFFIWTQSGIKDHMNNFINKNETLNSILQVHCLIRRKQIVMNSYTAYEVIE